MYSSIYYINIFLEIYIIGDDKKRTDSTCGSIIKVGGKESVGF
jgi:hypothetical protein